MHLHLLRITCRLSMIVRFRCKISVALTYHLCYYHETWLGYGRNNATQYGLTYIFIVNRWLNINGKIICSSSANSLCHHSLKRKCESEFGGFEIVCFVITVMLVFVVVTFRIVLPTSSELNINKTYWAKHQHWAISEIELLSFNILITSYLYHTTVSMSQKNVAKLEDQLQRFWMSYINHIFANPDSSVGFTQANDFTDMKHWFYHLKICNIFLIHCQNKVQSQPMLNGYDNKQLFERKYLHKQNLLAKTSAFWYFRDRTINT